MNCIKLHSSLLLSQRFELKHRQRRLGRHTNLPCLTSNINLYRTVQQSLHLTKAIPNSFVIAASSPPKSVDMSGFLQISALLLFLYFTANFIVPELISKYFGFDKVDKDQKANDVNTSEDR